MLDHNPPLSARVNIFSMDPDNGQTSDEWTLIDKTTNVSFSRILRIGLEVRITKGINPFRFERAILSF